MKEEQFCCPTEEVVNRVVESNSLDKNEETVRFHTWYHLVNTFDTEILSFSGWITIKGLPFDMWNEETFKHIGQKSGVLQEINQNPKNFSTYQKKSKLHYIPCLNPTISPS